MLFFNNVVFSLKTAIDYLLSRCYFFIIYVRPFFGGFCFRNIIIDSLNIDNHWTSSVFKRIKHLLYKYYPRFAKAYKKRSKRLDIRQFIILLQNCVLNMKQVWCIGKLLKNVTVLQVRTSNNPLLLYIVKL